MAVKVGKRAGLINKQHCPTGRTRGSVYLRSNIRCCDLVSNTIRNLIISKTKLRGLSPYANYTDRVAAAGRRS